MEPKIELTMDGYVECDGLTVVWLAENQLRCDKCAWRAPYVHSPERLRHYRVTADDSERLREAEATLARVEELAHYRLSSRSRLPHTPIYRLGFEDCQRYLRAALSPAPAVAEARHDPTLSCAQCGVSSYLHNQVMSHPFEPPAAPEPTASQVCGGLIGSRMCSKCSYPWMNRYGEKCDRPASGIAQGDELKRAVDALLDFHSGSRERAQILIEAIVRAARTSKEA